MKKAKPIAVICVLFIVIVSSTVAAQLRAFPGAEGFGAYATGGRGGIVYHVTHTRPDRSDGSLWKGLETSTQG